jgi:alkylation response protein AidB-like acyl-CoA dehydrogenase
MEVTFSEEREELRRSVRRFFDDKSPMSEVRRLIESEQGFDREVWMQMADQLGVQGLAIPERFGGSGFSYEELAVVFEEAGRALFSAPLFATVGLAAAAIMTSGDEVAQAMYLPGIADGSTVATLAYSEGARGWEFENITTRASGHDDVWTITGTKSFVIDGANADVILVSALTDVGLSLFAVERGVPGLMISPLQTLDLTRRQSVIDFNGVLGRLIGTEGSAAEYLSRTLDLAATVLSAEQVGGAERVLEMSVEYAKNRIQYGRPIGSYQAIKHKCSDMLVAVETSKSASIYARWTAASDSDELGVAASMAKAYSSDAYLRCASQNIQIHGGIGFTWEHDAHLYFRRAKSDDLLLGPPHYHRERLARLVGMTGAR